MPPEVEPEGLQPQEIVELLEATLLDGPPRFTSDVLADLTGVPKEIARQRWRSLGFTSVPDGVLAFTEADVRAVELTERLRELGVADDSNEAAFIRTIGRGFARMAEFEANLLVQALDLFEVDDAKLIETIAELGPLLEELMSYVWRRHLVNAGARIAFAGPGDGDEPMMVAGFADIVGYTRRSRSMRGEELAALVETFEARTHEIVAEHRGQVIKSIGDEVLYVTDDARDGALIALELVELAEVDAGYPELRVGLAYGPVLARLGDVYGPVVNLASRLTSVAKPRRVVIDRQLADELATVPDFRVRRMRRTTLKGFGLVEPWSLKRPKLTSEARSAVETHGHEWVR